MATLVPYPRTRAATSLEAVNRRRKRWRDGGNQEGPVDAGGARRGGARRCQEDGEPVTRTVSPARGRTSAIRAQSPTAATSHGLRGDARRRPCVEASTSATGARSYSTFRPSEVPTTTTTPASSSSASRLFAFISPHSGYRCRGTRLRGMRYRSPARRWAQAAGWGALRRVPLPRECGLGYTYPNPVVAGGRLYLFMRGPCWEPYFTWTKDGEHWRPGADARAPRPRAGRTAAASTGPAVRQVRAGG